MSNELHNLNKICLLLYDILTFLSKILILLKKGKYKFILCTENVNYVRMLLRDIFIFRTVKLSNVCYDIVSLSKDNKAKYKGNSFLFFLEENNR